MFQGYVAKSRNRENLTQFKEKRLAGYRHQLEKIKEYFAA